MFIERRKREEARQVAQSQHVSELHKLGLQNQFFSKPPRVMKSDDHSEDSESLLARREKLRLVLQSEESALIAELQSLQETPEQRRVRIEERAQSLKAEKEAERVAFVQEKLEQQWRQSVDELRTEQSRLARLESAAAHLEQIEQKKKTEEKIKREENIYESLNQYQFILSSNRALEEKRAKQQVITSTREGLLAQMEEKQLIQSQRKKIELQHDKQLSMTPNPFVIPAPRPEPVDYSARLPVATPATSVDERAIDRARISAELAKQQDELEATLALRKEYMMHVQKCMQAQIEESRKKNFQQTHIDRVYVESNERLWEKRLAELEERESRRRKLMEDVYAVRDAQVKEKADRIQKLKSEYTRQGEQLAAEAHSIMASGNQHLVNQLAQRREYHADLAAQIASREDERKKELQENAQYVKDESEWRRKLDDVIRSERGKQMEFAKQFIRGL
jgi:hypothetical protein